LLETPAAGLQLRAASGRVNRWRRWRGDRREERLAKLPDELLRGGRRWIAPYAADPEKARGRLLPEPESPLRSPFQRDRDRIIHSNAFRRLKHKTQVFILHEGDHYRTRLTHTLEVAQVARSIARPLGLDEDLIEALALSHDLGHPPFGHAGERALDVCAAPVGGFDHNVQALRVVTRLERRYPAFDGLNLTVETLDGLIKHNGPITPSHPAYRAFAVERERLGLDEIDFEQQGSVEAQVASLSDDIAYAAHDMEDGLRSGLIGLADLDAVPVTRRIARSIAAEHPGLDPARTVHEMQRRLITLLIEDAVAETWRRIRAAGVASSAEARRCGAPLAGFSEDVAAEHRELKAFLFRNVYRAPAVMQPVGEAERLVRGLFDRLAAEPAALPENWRERCLRSDRAARLRSIADYIAGMTDRFARAEERRLFALTAGTG